MSPLSTLLDRTLDLAVVPGYTSARVASRRASSWAHAAPNEV
jgi:hypothetical protein